MLPSKLQLILLTVGFASIFTGCSLPKSSPSDTGSASATFFVNSSDVSITTQKLDPKISIPVSKTFSFKVCVRDNRLSQTIINHRFEIQTESDTLSKTTDANGCLVWSEDIAYNHLAPAHYLELIRAIKAVGFQKGERSLRFAINPWENQAESLLDKNRSDLVPYKSFSKNLLGLLSDSGESVARPVWLDDLRLTVYEKQVSTKGDVLDFMIRTTPNLVTIKSSGDRVLEPLSYGEFDAEISLIHVVSENQKEVRRLLTAPIKTKGTMAEGYLNIEALITLNPICTRGQIEVALKLTPKNAPKNLLPFEGVFIGNECDQIKGSTFARLKNEFQEAKGQLHIEQYLTDKNLPATPLPSQDSQVSIDPNQPDYYQRAQIEIKKLSFDNVGFKDQRTLQRQKVFNLTACLNGLDQKGMRGQFFDVTKVNGSKEHIKSNDSGCISWDDSYEFNFLETECWKEASVQISNSNLSLNQTLKLHINPWGTGNTSIRDVRFLDAQGQALSCAQGSSQIVLNSYSYDKITYAYAMDSFMGLTMKKNVLFKLNPRIKRPSLTDPSGYAEEPLPIGAYALRWAVVDNSVSDLSQARDKIIQADEKLVNLNANSTIAEQLTLQTADVKAIGNTNRIFIELFPLKQNALALQRENPKLTLEQLEDPAAKVAHSTYWGTLILANNNEGTTLIPYADTPLSLIPRLKSQYLVDQATQLTISEKLSRKEKFAADNNLIIYNLNNPAQSQNLRANLSYARIFDKDQAKPKPSDLAPFSENKLKQWLRSGKMDNELIEKMCNFFAQELMRNPTLQKNVFSAKTASQIGELCWMAASEGHLSEAFEVQYRYFVKNPVLLKTENPEMRDMTISTGFAFQKGITNTISSSINTSLSLSGKGDIPFLSFLSGSASASYSVSRSHSENNAYGANQVFGTGVALTRERLQATIQVQGVEKCAMIKLGSAYFVSDQQKKASLLSSWLGGNTSIIDEAEPTASKEDIDKVLSKGLLICEGEASKTPTTFTENYYVLNQRMPYTMIVDPASDQSRPFFAFLRGDADLNRFMNYLEGSYTNPATGTPQDVNNEMTSEKLGNIFSYTPTYPGQIVRDN